MPSKIKQLITFRVTPFHQMMFRASPYARNKGILIRLLLDAYFNNELPQIKNKFFKEIQNAGTTRVA